MSFGADPLQRLESTRQYATGTVWIHQDDFLNLAILKDDGLAFACMPFTTSNTACYEDNAHAMGKITETQKRLNSIYILDTKEFARRPEDCPLDQVKLRLKREREGRRRKTQSRYRRDSHQD